MNSFLRAIGFSESITKKDIEKIINEVVNNPDEAKRVHHIKDEMFIQIKKDFGGGFGVMVHGTVDDRKQIDVDYYFPYCEAKVVQEPQEIIIEKQTSDISFAGVCDDIRVGVSLIFYLQNSVDYMTMLSDGHDIEGKKKVAFAALSNSGTVLLPTSKALPVSAPGKVDPRNRTSLIAAAREGDEEAIETLTLEDLDTYSQISRRILKEDVFTIVESSFMPYGVECDLYNIVGEILAVEKHKNTVTEENVYILKVICNDVTFDVCINERDLQGEPGIGRRFKGPIWMQGRVMFE